MNFNEAWSKRVVDELYTGKNISVQARINFDHGTASMVMPGYVKNEDEAMSTLKRAWETYLKGKDGEENSINSIIIEAVDVTSIPKAIHGTTKISA